MKTTKHLIQYLRTLHLPSDSRPKHIAVSLGLALAGQLSLPAGKVHSVRGYYTSTHQRTVGEVISEINEEIVFDANFAMKMVRDMYVLRYTFAFNPTDMNVPALMSVLAAYDDELTDPAINEYLKKETNAKAVRRTVSVVASEFRLYKEVEKEEVTNVAY